ncbi:MAG: hypothetical protein ACI89Z_000009 [Porticoccus sp.]|jgi:hypothetical protein
MDNKPSNTRELLIEELDLLRHALDDGSEFQHTIPMLNEDIRDTSLPALGSMVDLDAEIPTFTDFFDETNTVTSETPSLEPPLLKQPPSDKY